MKAPYNFMETSVQLFEGFLIIMNCMQYANKNELGMFDDL